MYLGIDAMTKTLAQREQDTATETQPGTGYIDNSRASELTIHEKKVLGKGAFGVVCRAGLSKTSTRGP